MKKILLIILSTLIIPVSAQAGYQYYGCDKKIYQLERVYLCSAYFNRPTLGAT
ncbi:hypothetical protein AB7W24_17650 [Providencia rettgeri]